MIYDQAVYDILYYDANLDAYRTDRFAGWQNLPSERRRRCSRYGTLNYTQLTDAKAVAESRRRRGARRPPGAGPAPAAAVGRAPAPAPSAGLGQRRQLRLVHADPRRVVVVVVDRDRRRGRRRRSVAAEDE